MNCAFTHTLSKREIFMAFIVSASTNIGGPSSNTSLMNSFPQFETRTRGLRKRNHQHHKIQILSSQFVLHRLQCEICSLVKCCSFPLALATSQIADYCPTSYLYWLSPASTLHYPKSSCKQAGLQVFIVFKCCVRLSPSSNPTPMTQMYSTT